MGAFLLDMPPSGTGSERDDLIRMRSYLYQMAEQLNGAMNSISAENMAPAEAEAMTAATTGENNADIAVKADTLRSLIIKTADTVQASIDEITSHLESKTFAESVYGQVQELVTSDMTATASGMLTEYATRSELNAYTTGAAFSSYVTDTKQYIKTGTLYYDGTIPIMGIAVGEKLTTVVEDGVEILRRGGFCATFTSGKMSFWNDETEIAYFSSNKLFVSNAEITDRMKVGRYIMKRMEDGSMAIMYDGGSEA